MNASNDNNYVWNANDWSNLITISASAIASVLLVVFKSRCKKINLCCGLLNCDREVKDDDDDNNNNNQQNNQNNNNINNNNNQQNNNNNDDNLDNQDPPNP